MGRRCETAEGKPAEGGGVRGGEPRGEGGARLDFDSAREPCRRAIFDVIRSFVHDSIAFVA